MVDDDPQKLRYVRDPLAKAGYAPIVTGDPEEALSLIGANNPHLVLLDLLLPGTDGIELMKDILKTADVPVIFLSVHGQNQIIASAFDAGAFDCVVKPFSPTELVARIRAALRGRAAAERAEPTEPCVLGKYMLTGQLRRTQGDRCRASGPADRHRVPAALRAFGQRGRVLTYDHLLQRVWGLEKSGDLRPMRTVVRNRRRKLGDDANGPTYIFTEPRVGYHMPKAEEPG